MAITTSGESAGAAARAPVRARPPAWWAAVALGLAGVGYRLVMLLSEVPLLNSDEATSGLVAGHIAQGREFPLFFYGQHYMGALESYLAAPLFALFGASTLALRLPNLLLYLTFLVLMWQLTRRLYTPWLATFTIGLLALGSDRILKNQLIAGGGYPEMNPAGALLVLLAVNLRLGVVRRKALAHAGWGLVVGLTLWDDWLILPYVGAAGLVLLGGRWRVSGARSGLALGAGLLVGLVPIVGHNLTAPAGERSWAIYATLSGGEPVPWPDRLYGGVLFGLPMGTGLCAPSRCEPWQMWWGMAYPALLVAAGVLAVRALRRTGSDRARQAGRLALVVAAGLSLFAYAGSSAAGETPVESARYLSCLSISTPAVLWPLWRMAGTSAGVGRRSVLPRVAAGVPLAFLLVTMTAAMAALIGQAPAIARQADDRRALVSNLDRLGISRLYSEYWTCNNITFETRERIICAVVQDDLRSGWDRYPPHRDLVRGADLPAYVLPAGSTLSAAVAAYLGRTETRVTTTTAAGYDIYQTSTPVDLPLP